MDIEFEVNCQSIKRVNNPQPANKSQKYLQLCFDFKTDDWIDLTKFALFKANNTNYRESITNDKVLVPNACLQENTFSFTIYGIDNDEMRITTNQVYVHLNESGYSQEVENDIPDDDPSIVEEIYLAIAAKSDIGHTHTEADITDLGNYVPVSDIVDDLTSSDAEKPLSANQGEVLKGLVDGKSDSNHTHDERYYTQSEVDNLIKGLLTRVNITSDKRIIQTDEVADVTSYYVNDGVPMNDKTIYFYEKSEEE